MNPNVERLLTVLKSGYHKLAMLVVLTALLLSTARLISRLQQERAELAQKKWEQPPANPEPVHPENEAPILATIDKLRDPIQIPQWSIGLLTAELRVGCVKCGKPIPYNAEACPFCGEPQPSLTPSGYADTDTDGMPDEWEKEFELNPYNANDAQYDPDEDGFSNLEEYEWDTSPTDPKSHPPLAIKLRIAGVRKVPFNFVFIGTQKISDANVFYGLKNKMTGKDDYLKIGDTLEGYQLIGYEPKKITVKKGSNIIEEDVSVLILKKEDKTIRLPLGREVEQPEMVATLDFTLDTQKFSVKVGAEIQLKDEKYKIVDIAADAVLVFDEKTEAEYKVTADSVSRVDKGKKKETEERAPEKNGINERGQPRALILEERL